MTTDKKSKKIGVISGLSERKILRLAKISSLKATSLLKVTSLYPTINYMVYMGIRPIIQAFIVISESSHVTHDAVINDFFCAR